MILGTDLFADFDTSITASEDPGLLLISARLRENNPSSVDRALKEIEQFCSEVVCEGVSEYDLQRAKNQFESNLIFGNVSNSAKARNMAMNEYHGQTSEMMLEQVNGFTTERIASVIKETFRNENKSTLLYLPK